MRAIRTTLVGSEVVPCKICRWNDWPAQARNAEAWFARGHPPRGAVCGSARPLPGSSISLQLAPHGRLSNLPSQSSGPTSLKTVSGTANCLNHS